MTMIIEVLGMKNYGKYATVEVVTNVGDVAQVYVGGDVEVFFHRGAVKAFVKKNKEKLDD